MVAFCLFQLVVIIYYTNPKVLSYDDIPYSNQIQDIKSATLNKGKNTCNVIIIGSSLVGFAVGCPDEIAAASSNYKTKHISLKKIWQSGDRLKYMVEHKNLIQELLRLKPDLICIQTELAAIRFKEIDKYFYSEFEKYLEDLARKNITIFKDIFMLDKFTYTKCQEFYFLSEVAKDTLAIIPSKRFVKELADVEYLRSGLKALINAGIKIVILDIPRPRKTALKVYTSSFIQQLNPMLDFYQKEFGIAHWAYSGRDVYYSDTIDGAHLNEKGRQLFTSYLLQKIIIEMGAKK